MDYPNSVLKIVRLRGSNDEMRDQLKLYKEFEDYHPKDLDITMDWKRLVLYKIDFANLEKDYNAVDVFPVVEYLTVDGTLYPIPIDARLIECNRGSDEVSIIRTYYVTKFLVLRFSSRQMAVLFKLAHG